MKCTSKPNLVVIAAHPVQYHSGVYDRLAEKLGARFQVWYCSPGLTKPSMDTAFGQHIQWDVDLLSGHHHTIFPNHGWDDRGLFTSRINPALLMQLVRDRPTVVLLTGWSRLTELSALILGRLLGSKIILRGEATLRASTPSLASKWAKMFIFSLAHTILYSCKGNFEFFRHHGVRPSKMERYPCAVDNARFGAEGHNFRALQETATDGAGSNLPIFLTVSALIPRKRIDRFFNALKKSLAAEAQVLIVGAGSERLNLELLAERLGLNAVFLGFRNQSELPSIYKAADVFFLLSDHDNSPKCINEAMASGIPCIVTKHAGQANDLVRDRANGWIVDPCNEESIISAIDATVTDPHSTTQFASCAHEDVQAWSFEACAQGVMRSFE